MKGFLEIVIGVCDSQGRSGTSTGAAVARRSSETPGMQRFHRNDFSGALTIGL